MEGVSIDFYATEEIGTPGFNANQFILDECVPERFFLELPIFDEITIERGTPVYLFLLGLRPDGGRRLAVGSLKGEDRTTPSTLTGSLATRVYDIAPDGSIAAQGTIVKPLE